MIPANDLLTKADRMKIMKTRKNRDRPISRKEREVLLKSLEAYKDAGSEDSKMIYFSVLGILGLY